MIHNLYETHIEVKDLNTSIEFYKNLGLELSLLLTERKIAFFLYRKGPSITRALGSSKS